MNYIIAFIVALTFMKPSYAELSAWRLSQAGVNSKNVSEYSGDHSSVYYAKDIGGTYLGGDTVYKSRKDLDDELRAAINLYKSKKYAEALVPLQELSQWGVKPAQALLGQMYIHGLSVERSVMRAMAWYGVAKEVNTERHAAKAFDSVYKQLKKEQREKVDNTVDSYIAKFGVKAQNFKCKRRITVGSNIRQTECIKRAKSNSMLHAVS